MKTGIEEIAEERAEQINKHGITLERDQQYDSQELIDAAVSIATDSPAHWPWNPTLLVHYKSKSTIEKLRIAGALLAAEIDRLKSLESEVSNA